VSTGATLAADDFKKGLIVSAAVHSVIFLIAIAKVFISHDLPIADMPSIRVDLVALPDKLEALPEPMPAPAPPATEAPKQPEQKAEPLEQPKLPPKPAPKEPDTINIKKALDTTKAKQNDAIKKLKSLQALDKIKESLAKEALLQKSKQVKGNILAPGTELRGLDKLQHEQYKNLVDRRIKPNWQLAEWLARKNLVAVVLIKIDFGGQLVSKQVVKSSGNPDFDQSVFETIDKSIPLPAPPEKLAALVAANGILIEFGE
jgi:TonB family protein